MKKSTANIIYVFFSVETANEITSHMLHSRAREQGSICLKEINSVAQPELTMFLNLFYLLFKLI